MRQHKSRLRMTMDHLMWIFFISIFILVGCSFYDLMRNIHRDIKVLTNLFTDFKLESVPKPPERETPGAIISAENVVANVVADEVVPLEQWTLQDYAAVDSMLAPSNRAPEKIQCGPTPEKIQSGAAPSRESNPYHKLPPAQLLSELDSLLDEFRCPPLVPGVNRPHPGSVVVYDQPASVLNRKMGRPKKCRLPIDPAEPVMSFGKHKGKPLSHVPDSYISWLKRSYMLTPQLEQDFIKVGKIK